MGADNDQILCLSGGISLLSATHWGDGNSKEVTAAVRLVLGAGMAISYWLTSDA